MTTSDRSRSNDRMRSARRQASDIPRTSSDQGQRGSRQGSGRRRINARGGSPNRGRGSGYALKQHNIRFRGNGIGSIGGYDPRMLAFLAGGALLVIILLFSLVSCVSGCVAGKKESETVQSDQGDSRIASGLSDTLTANLTSALDADDKLSKIAKNAGKYSDEAIVQFALDEPAAIDFVSQVPSAEKKATAYEDTVKKGTVPSLVSYDTRWGFVDYAGLPLGVSGSGPTCMSMAYMALTGKGDKSPADMATLATENNYAGGDAYTKEDFFSKCAATVSLYCETPSVSADEIAGSLQNSHPVICLVKANTLTTKAHYVICAGVNSDGTLVVYDPISSEVSSRPWAVSTIVSYSSKIFVMHPSSDGTGGSSSDASGADDASSTDEASSDSSSE